LRILLLSLILLLFAVEVSVGECQTPLYVKVFVDGGNVRVKVDGISFIGDPTPLDETFYPAWAALASAPTDIGLKIWGLMAATVTGYLQISTRNPLIHVSSLQYHMLTWPVYLNFTDVYGNTYRVKVGRECYTLLKMNISFADINLFMFRVYSFAWKALHITAPLELKEYNVGIDLVPFSKATLINASILPPLDKWKWYFNGTHTIIRYWSNERFCTSTIGGRRACYDGVRAEIVVKGYAISAGGDNVVVPTHAGMIIAGAMAVWASAVIIQALAAVLKRVFRKENELKFVYRRVEG